MADFKYVMFTEQELANFIRNWAESERTRIQEEKLSGNSPRIL